MKKVLYLLSALCFIAGVCILAVPVLKNLGSINENTQKISAFRQEATAVDSQEEASEEEQEYVTFLTPESSDDVFAGLLEEKKSEEYQQLLADSIAFNKALYADGQAGKIADMNSMQALDFDMRKYGFDSQLYAYISIPAINLQLPIYTNVTSKTLANGAARLSSTSLPIGGENTNCVLAGHSGYQNPLFTNITKLKAGDTITIWNLWEELTYEVVSTKKILPTDIDSVMIQEGKDMVTLMTCTPVHVNTYRYLVYCERVTE